MNTDVRRIVTVDSPLGKSFRRSDGPVTDIVTDPARPGFRSFEIWAANASPLSGGAQPAPLGRHRPPPGGSLCRVIDLPPDNSRSLSQSDAAAFFASMGAPSLSEAPLAHPYMQKTGTLDFCLILEGRATLVLDTGEVELEAGDTVVQLGSRHAWSNRSSALCRIAISMIDGYYDV